MQKPAICLVALMACWPTPGLAQPVDETGSKSDGAIVVTALRRETNADETPMAVSAIAGEALQEAGITDLAHMPIIPGLTIIDGGPQNTRLAIRGIQSVGEPTTGLYYDNVPVTGIVGPSNDAGGTIPRLQLYDIERIEVTRGPQGTLYGASSMSGNVNVIFRKPTERSEGYVGTSIAVTSGGNQTHKFDAMINIPILRDKASLRAVAFLEDLGGYIDNPVLGLRNADDRTASGGRLLLRITPTPKLTIDGALIYQRSTGDRSLWTLEGGDYTALNQVRLPSPETFIMGSVNAHWKGETVEVTGTASISHRKYNQALGDVSYFFQSLRGNEGFCARFTGTNCSALELGDYNDYIDLLATGVVVGLQDSTTQTAELRFNSVQPDPIRWTIGSFFSRRDFHDDNNQFDTNPATGEVIRPYIRRIRRLIDDKLSQQAVFAEVSVTPTARIEATLGTRYFRYQRAVGGNTVVPLPLVNVFRTDYALIHSRESGAVFKANLAFKASDNELLYVQAAQGFRPGGVNQVLGLPDDLAPYRSDELWTYEIGSKSTLFDNRVRLDIAAYQSEWKDMQILGMSPLLPFSFISNAGAARVRGIEAEISLNPLNGLAISASAAFTDARLSEDQRNDQIIAAGKRGDRIPFVPRFTAGTSLSYNWSIGSSLRPNVGIVGRYRGPVNSEFRIDNPYFRRLPSYALFDARIGLESTHGWAANVFVDNIFNKLAITTELATRLTAGQTLVTSSRPRTFGFGISRNFP